MKACSRIRSYMSVCHQDATNLLDLTKSYKEHLDIDSNWPILPNIVQYCPISSDIVQYCQILPNIVQYWSSDYFISLLLELWCFKENSDIVKHCQILPYIIRRWLILCSIECIELSNIVQYCPISSSIAQYCPVFFDVVQMANSAHSWH